MLTFLPSICTQSNIFFERYIGQRFWAKAKFLFQVLKKKKLNFKIYLKNDKNSPKIIIYSSCAVQKSYKEIKKKKELVTQGLKQEPENES